ncbi:hypothetical protein DIC66_17725 [Rhodoferax lacus]|uniref:YMGG-like Gly-zipper domain-containing protein n=1 Tax=Rhodoferax lacus TaxID=2184758 RepID=A0A3E1R8E9_9BURK|nr:glycine zipper domain-containing protein [Rhodoferax lacus]RFO95636.1 hypothetical protein DIC66_17725 [Rhodoferax lacus]
MFTSARSNTTLRASAVLALALTGLAGQAAHADNLNPILGGGLGAMAGAFIGQSMGGRDGAMIGAAVGGVAGVSIASNNGYRRQESVRTVVYDQPYRQAPVYAAPVYAAPVVVAPSYGYRVVERVNYYPVHDYGRRGWGGHDHGHDDRSWGRRDEYRHDDHRGGDHRGWDRRD